jgi:hypothetical protein
MEIAIDDGVGKICSICGAPAEIHDGENEYLCEFHANLVEEGLD